MSRASLVMSGGRQRKSSCTMTSGRKVWACAKNGKKASGTEVSDGSRATESKAQGGKATNLRLHSQ